MSNKDKRWRTPTQADLRLSDKKDTLLKCKVRNSTSQAWIHGHILSDIDLVGKYPFQTYDPQGKYRKWKWCVIQDDTPEDPKFLIGSSVICERIGINTQCIVYRYNENDGDGMRGYIVYPLYNPSKTYDCREDELKPWVEPPKPAFVIGDRVRVCKPGSVFHLCDGSIANISDDGEIRVWTGQRLGSSIFHSSELQPVKSVNQDQPKPVQDNQTYTNEKGGKQSFVSARFDCIPPVVLRLLAQCLGFGARKYGKDNWKQIEQWDHLSHAVNHINEWNRGDRSEPHLVNAMARLTFALWQAVDSKDQPDTYIHSDEIK